jgi:hypothetical protein
MRETKYDILVGKKAAGKREDSINYGNMYKTEIFKDIS